ncbi:MAG: 2-oxoglutarate dehydrogenase E1 component [Phycisphaerales bacterium]|nr:2-oxoglutarate dehydrogenase E1 component [Phycisphaerales bacterium]
MTTLRGRKGPKPAFSPSDDQPLPSGESMAFADELYAQFMHDPAAVPPDWRRFFEQLGAPMNQAAQTGPSFAPSSIFNPPGSGQTGDAGEIAAFQHRVDLLVRAYRVSGHFDAIIDPLNRVRMRPQELDYRFYQLTETDLDRPVAPRSIAGPQVRTLRELIDRLEQTYCRSIGVEVMHIDDLAIRQWLLERIENIGAYKPLTREEQLRILTRLTDASIFEQFVLKKFVGKKSFSLEGGETLIPLLDIAIETAAAQGLKGIILGMAHRGRLNVLANIMGKSPSRIFREFDDVDPELHIGRGDVKYHLGYSSDWKTADGRTIHLSLCFNPSHLEFVNPVALGRMRANQDRVGDHERKQGMVVMIHGDAAIAGQGIAQEIINLSQLDGYTTGGSLHVVVNNQVGFTTSPHQGRSSAYCTDVFKMLPIPVFHVNGEDPEAVARVVHLAMDFRATFQRDVVIDMYCFRRWGHNESDEPSFTQPLMYKTITQRPSVRDSYLDHLLKLSGITQEDADKVAKVRREHLDRDLNAARSGDTRPRGPEILRRAWAGLVGGPDAETPDVETGVSVERLAQLLNVQTRMPQGFTPHAKIERLLEARRAMATGAQPLDWSAGEALAFATLLAEGTSIRMTGQDCERGTFSHRHAVLHDVDTDRVYIPLRHLGGNQGVLDIHNSPLSEAGVLGFEYGYSVDYPETLVIWEAQFGDFVNVAQVIIDQFIASAEQKWRRLSGVTMLLPHGFEGEGPEHSSARLERFLQLCAHDNMQVAYPTTPAQIFHLLRRQIRRPWRKPLIVMTPKSLLRLPAAVSTLADCAAGTFHRVIGDARLDNAASAKKVRRVLLTSGKLYYELVTAREAAKRDDVAIVRVEQLYPLPTRELDAALQSVADGTQVMWVQEEPENMGAGWFMRLQYGERLFGRLPLGLIARPASASPATGSKSSHKIEQERILESAFE